MNVWQLQEAKARLSEVIKEAVTHGPQEITLRGKPAVVLISKQKYDELTHPKASFVQFMQASPLAGLKLPLKRNKSLTRDQKIL